MKLFVTGGAGFLGSVIINQLCGQGHEVVTFSRRNYPAQNLINVTHIQGDLFDYPKLKKAMTGCEAVFHIAAKVGMWGHYEDFYRTNVIGTKNVLQACREMGIRYLVFTSSPSVVYSGKNTEGQNESLHYPEKYNAWYPQTKAVAEKLVIAANDSNLKTVSLRPHLIWGPGDHELLPRLIEKARAGTLRIIGDGTNLVDCIYVENAASAHVLAFNQLISDSSRVEGKTYFISQGNPIPIAELMNQLLATAGISPVTNFMSAGIARFAGRFLETTYRIFGITSEPVVTYFLAQQLSTSHWYDISAARSDFGFKAEISIEEGMERLKNWNSIEKDKKNYSRIENYS